jgi:hypothetical protein
MKNLVIKIIAVLSYLSMVFVNFLANALPINNRSTGAISESYSNLFAPAGITFSIWGLIYILLGGYLLYQFISFKSENKKKKENLLKKINILFILTSIANITWIFSWHYDFIGLSVIIMSILLILLIKIANTLRTKNLTLLEKQFILIPFSVYFGWITIATIANITVFLVSIGWNGFGIADYIWTTIILIVGLLVGLYRTNKDKNVSYIMVLIWAYCGILIKHISPDGFNSNYPIIIITLLVCLVIFVFFTIYQIYKKYK